jgi:hypothetical protein
MKMSYCQPQGHTCHFIGQAENPFKIIKVIKHLNFLDSRFSGQQIFKKSHLSEKRVPRKPKQIGIAHRQAAASRTGANEPKNARYWWLNTRPVLYG